MELPITLEEKDRRRMVRQAFMVAKIDAPYNTILDRQLLNELSAILSPKYLLMKFEIRDNIH